MRFETPVPGDRLLERIIRLAKSARDTVGFLPDSAFTDRADRGTLLACLDGEKLCGYALYDLPRDEIRLGQLVVSKSAQGRGIARLLVDRIEQRHSSRRGIFLRCRNDFAANEMWPHLGFTALAERAGRSFDQKPLTFWWRDFGHATLFSLQAETDSRPIAVLDACVFFDLAEAKPLPAIQQLRSDWINEHVSLAVSNHIFEEIRRGKDQARRNRERARAQPFVLRHEVASASNAALDQLRQRHPNAPDKDKDDLTHLAHAIAAGATWMVTGDRTFRNRYGSSAAALGGVKLVSAGALVKGVDELARQDLYEIQDLAGTIVSRREVDSERLGALAERFVNHRGGEKIRDLRDLLENAASRTDEVRLQLIEVDGEPRALMGTEKAPPHLSVLLARTSSGKGETTLARHLLAALRDSATASKIQHVRVVDHLASSAVLASYQAEGFALSADGKASAYPIEGRGTLAELKRRLHVLGHTPDQPDSRPNDSTLEAAQAEIACAPYRVLGAGLRTFIVSIKPTWARNLFSAKSPQGELMPREWTLGLRREQIYYRSPHAPGGIEAPARILWYVSGPNTPGGGEIRGVSQLREVVKGPAVHLHNRFKRLGTYSLQQVEGSADKTGTAMALRFSHTQEFDRGIGLDDLRRILTGDPKSRRVTFQSPTLVDEQVFVDILLRGFPDAP